MSNVMEKDFILFASKAHALLQQEKAENALHLSEAGVRRFPRYADGHMVLGMCYKALGRTDEARAEFERAITFAPNNLAAMNALAEINRENGLHQIARDWQIKKLMYFPYDDALQEELAGELARLPLEAHTPPEAEETAPEDRVQELLDEVDEEMIVGEELMEEEPPVKDPAEEEDLSTLMEETGDVSAESDVQISDRFDPLADELILEESAGDMEKPDLSGFDKTDEDFASLMTDMFSPEAAETAESPENDEEEWLEVQDIIIEEQPEPEAEIPVVEEKAAPVNETDKLISELELVSEEEEALLMDDEPFEENVEEQSPSSGPEQPVSGVGEEDVTIEKLMLNPNLITPTFGEILIAQKKFAEARHVFMELSKREPDNPRFVRKISFLEKFLQVQ